MARHCEEYIGDGVYAYITDWGDIVLYTSNGVEETNHIVLEPEVLVNFNRWKEMAVSWFAKELAKKRKEEQESA